MTKESKDLYFKNWYVYDVFINLAFFLLAIGFLRVNVPHVFTSILIILYGTVFIASLHNVYLSIKHRIMPDFYTSLFTRIFKNLIKLAELSIYLNVAYYMYKVEGVLFFLSMSVLVLALIRTFLTLSYIFIKLKDEYHLYFKKLDISTDISNYLTDNRLIIQDLQNEFTDAGTFIDGELKFYRVKDPNPVHFHKFGYYIFVLDYRNNTYKVSTLNKYMGDNNKTFQTLTINELDYCKFV